jgi:hypothetical protein
MVEIEIKPNIGNTSSNNIIIVLFRTILRLYLLPPQQNYKLEEEEEVEVYSLHPHRPPEVAAQYHDAT